MAKITPVVVLSQSSPAPQVAMAYATLLAKTMAVPVRQLRVAPAPTPAIATTGSPWAGAAETRLGVPAANGFAEAETIGMRDIAPVLAAHDALLVVTPRPANASCPIGWLAPSVWSLLQNIRPPLLLVPDEFTEQGIPLHIALVADGEPFVLVHGQRAMHALLLTLPIQITVFHAPTAHSTSSVADALQTLLACGLAARYLTTATTLVVPAHSAEAGILAGTRQIRADLLVLIIRQASLGAAGFGTGTMAALMQQSAVPVLLLLAAETTSRFLDSS